MNSTVFMIDPSNSLTELRQSDYDSEDLFQRLLGDHPTLLREASGPSGQLLLVRREAPVPEAQDSGGRWSLDHLFLDRDGVPVLVEVKRATDTRARREVVAQMLDYAANGVAYWPIEEIVEAFEKTSRSSGAEPDSALQEFLGDSEPEAFWRQVESNLRSGRVRMVFVADRIPRELRRIVEFLNEQMRPAEVLAIEVAQFTAADGYRLLTPKLIGATERASTTKSITAIKPPIDEAEWIESLRQKKGDEAAHNAIRLLDWYRSQGFTVGMTDSQDSMFARLTKPDGKLIWPFFIRKSNGGAETALAYLISSPAFAAEEERIALLGRLKSLPEQKISTTKTKGFPSVPLPELSKPEVWAGFTAIVEDVKARILAAQVLSDPFQDAPIPSSS